MENRSLALRYLSDALNLDSNGSYQAAFTKYLQSLHVLTLYLNEMFASLAVIVDSGKKNSAVNVIHKKVPDNVLTDIDIMDSKSSKLLKRYQWRFERAADKNAKANLKLELQRQLIENDMIAKKKFDIERVQWMEQEMKKLLETKKNLNDKQKEKQELYLTVLQYTKTETWPCTWELSSSEMMPTEAAKKIFQKTVRCSGHPLAQWLLVMQTNIKREIDTMLKHHSDYQVLLPEPSLILEENKLNISEFPDEFIIETSISGTIHISKKMLSSLQKFLGTISSEITDTIENILEIFYLIYKSLLPEDSEEICHRLIETHILDPIWSNLIILFRITNISSEYKIVETMIYHRNSDPAKFGFSNDENIDLEVYENSICLLQNVIKSNSMTEKLRCIVNVAKTICGNPSNNQPNPNRRKLGADDLIPLLCYIIVKSGLPQLSSECFAIEQLFDMKYMFGEEGYALSSFLTALKYIEIRKVIDEEHNEQD
ncbi:VPS9 domain-containing protein 1 [Caerostris extrusa]|uniref:VPS9 domain-containing protein 1 n=1 Tax=Caerostris extrusa TaxID=172846 RepID=A0AAV4QU20_CAEEX|nr:VPS9 domain-containing protein 1 [Caerostris extrusa]